MRKNTTLVQVVLSVAAVLATVVSPFQVTAAHLPAPTTVIGEWTVATLAKNGEWNLEAYKVDRGLAAWTERNQAGSLRRLYAYDGVRTRMLAEMHVTEWDNRDPYFTETVKGAFDVANGIVAWTMSDGNDREIYMFDGESTKKVSENNYDDRHPVVGAGRIAWTSQPDSAYNLMVRESNGTVTRVASWHVMNYAFSGKTLFWIAKAPGQDWFSVFRNVDASTLVVGIADDRPLTSYFFTDGKGDAAWEFSTKRWDYDHREVFVSYQGNPALRVLERYVPPRLTRVEDMDGAKVMVNAYDWQYMRIPERNSLVEASPSGEKAISLKEAMVKVRYMDTGYVFQREPNANIRMSLRMPSGEESLTLEPVIRDLFDADGTAAAGAKVGGGMILYSAGSAAVIAPSSLVATDLMVKNGDVMWSEGSGNDKTFKYATQSVLVKTAYGPRMLSGFLVKAPDSAAVYLAANDGKRYLFPSANQFYDWFRDFRSVRTVSRATLSGMPLAGNVLFRPGVRLVKTPSSPRVYAVGDAGTIYWVASADVLKSVYGTGWQGKIAVIGDSQLGDYVLGPSITSNLTYFTTVARKVNR